MFIPVDTITMISKNGTMLIHAQLDRRGCVGKIMTTSLVDGQQTFGSGENHFFELCESTGAEAVTWDAEARRFVGDGDAEGEEEAAVAAVPEETSEYADLGL